MVKKLSEQKDVEGIANLHATSYVGGRFALSSAAGFESSRTLLGKED